MKRSVLHIVLIFTFLSSLSVANAEVIFSENFGSGVGLSSVTCAEAQGTMYTSGKFDSKYYVLTENTSQIASMDTAKNAKLQYTFVADHTGGDGRMLVSNTPKDWTFYSKSVSGLCKNAKYKLTAYVNFLAGVDNDFKVLINGSSVSRTIDDPIDEDAEEVYAYDGMGNRYPLYYGTEVGQSVGAYYAKKGDELYLAHRNYDNGNYERFDVGDKVPYNSDVTWSGTSFKTDGAVTGKSRPVSSKNGIYIYQNPSNGNYYMVERQFDLNKSRFYVDVTKTQDLKESDVIELFDIEGETGLISYTLCMVKKDGSFVAKHETYVPIIGVLISVEYYEINLKRSSSSVIFHETRNLVADDVEDFKGQVNLVPQLRFQRSKWRKVTAEFTCTNTTTSFAFRSGKLNRVGLDDIVFEHVPDAKTPVVSNVSAECYTGSALPLTVSLNDESISPLTYEWSVSVGSGSPISYNKKNISIPMSTYGPISFKVRATSGCNHSDWYEVSSAYYGAPETTWTGAVDGDWSNASNWTQGTPSVCSDVTITANGNYPEIESLAECKNITFSPNSGVLGLRNLTYEKAFVQTEYKGNRWYAVTSPLKKMYSGDYYFNGVPSSFLGVFTSVVSDDFGGEVADWSKPFPELNRSLDREEGFIYKVDENEFLEFPRRNDEGEYINVVYYHNSITKTLITQFPIALNRGESGEQFRFRVEGSNNKIPATKSVSIEANKMNIVGNPLMTHLNLVNFWNENDDITDIKIFSNGTIYSIGKDGVSAAIGAYNHIVAPTQAFFVKSKQGSITFDIDNDFVKGEGVELRSNSYENDEPTMHIEVKSGEVSSYMALGRRMLASDFYGTEDAIKLLGTNETVDVYSIVDGKALDIDIFFSDLRIVPIGLSSKTAKTVKIKFIDTDSFYDVDVFLVNKRTGEEVNLKEITTYEYTMQSAKDEGNLFIEFRTTENIVTNVENATVAPIEIYADRNIIRIVSSEESIETVAVMDDLGRIVTKQTVNAPTTEIIMSNQPIVYTIHVVTASQSATRRVVIR